MKKFTGKLRSSSDSPSKRIRTSWSAFTRHSLRPVPRWPSELIEMCGKSFLSQYVHRTYNAYVLSQFKKLEQDLRNHGQIRWKHVMHLIRLLLSGVVVLRNGLVPLRVDNIVNGCWRFAEGDVPWEEVEHWRLALHRELDDALRQRRCRNIQTIRAPMSFCSDARRICRVRGVRGMIDFELLQRRSRPAIRTHCFSRP